MNVEIEQVNKLAQMRRAIGYSQHILAEISGINIRMIQQYETGARDINKASIHTVWLLAKALRCSVDDIIDVEVDAITNCIVKRTSGEECDTGAEIIRRTIIPAEAKNDINHGWCFNWHEIQEAGYTIVELFTKKDNKLQGRIAFREMENYFFISHVENAPKNVGTDGEYEGVAANLFAVVCKMSKDKGYDGVVSFMSKKDDRVMNNYIEKMHAKRIGNSQLMIIDEDAADYLIESYGL